MLEATTSGAGIALVWRALIDRNIDEWALISLRLGLTRFDRVLNAGLSGQVQQRVIAYRCPGF